jgi:amidohydrolase
MTILEKTQAIEAQMIEWRREFHRHPEIGFHEHWTAARIATILETLGCRVRTGVGKTGVVGEIGQGNPIVGIRADMDALPIMEANRVPYASENPGFMHACGHDAHTAMALGAAAVLVKERFPGTVRFLHQPAEEVNDEEGISGAPRMIAAGALDGMDLVIALHVDPSTPVGDIRVAPARVRAASIRSLLRSMVAAGMGQSRKKWSTRSISPGTSSWHCTRLSRADSTQ